MPIQRNPVLWTRAEIDQRTHGTWLSGASIDWQATGVRREPHRVTQGDLFITAGPIGQDVVANNVNLLFARGAVAVVTSFRPSAEALWGPVLLVSDTAEVYESLAKASVERSKAKIIGVTGSVGKTGTKDAIAHVLSQQSTVLSSPGSANSDTVILEVLCQLSHDIAYAVLELGMLGPNSMRRRASLCRPHVAVITAIAGSHRRHHESEFSIAQTKADILDGVTEGGVAVLPRDSRFFEYLVDRARSTPNVKDVITFGQHADADVHLVKQQLRSNVSDVEVQFHDVRLKYRVGLPGAHHVANSLAVLGSVIAAGADLRSAATALSSLTPTFRRGERFRIQLPLGDCEIIDDSWNASPESVSAAICTLTLRPIPVGGRRIVVLGDMLELGPDERRLHRDLVEVLESAQIDLVHTVGTLMHEVHEALRNDLRGRHFSTSSEMAKSLQHLMLPGDCLLVKGSHATEMSRVVLAALRGRPREECAAPRNWSLAAEMIGEVDSENDVDQGVTVGTRINCTDCSTSNDPSTPELLARLRNVLASGGSLDLTSDGTQKLLEASPIPTSCWGFAVTLYQPNVERLMVVRAAQSTAFENVRQVLRQIPKQVRFHEFDLADWNRCRMQVDFIIDEPQPVALAELSDSVLPDERVESGRYEASDVSGLRRYSKEAHHAEGDGDMEAVGSPWQVLVASWALPKNRTRFELGVDGLRIVKEGKRRYFLPGDAFVHSILGIAQLRRHIQRLFPGDDIEQLTYFRFRSLSFVSGVEEGAWIPLYRGLPPVPQLSDASLLQAARAGTKWIADSLQHDGRFVYYYDAVTDTGRDHEHPTRDPETDPYYNLLRHGGGTITLLLEEQLKGKMPRRDPAYDYDGYDGATDQNQRRDVIERTLDFLVKQLVGYKAANGKESAYALYNHKAKLGGSGVGLCALAMYQRLFEDERYEGSAERLANHLIGEINDQGEFRYYHVYLDKPVAWEDNQRYFSFYYPGEAILGLSQYCQHGCRSAGDRREIYAKTHQALRFLLRDRPRLHKEHYQTLPADSWLMMGVNDLWNEPEFQQDEYAQFVFDDADQMVRLMYTDDDALYPDYVGSFYYRYGDHPYPDGARAEGLLAAYQLALKVGARERIERYRNACRKVAWATLRLCNTADSVYSLPNPSRAIGGIRFKLTRQWFRVDTIQHVASFFLKLVATESA